MNPQPVTATRYTPVTHPLHTRYTPVAHPSRPQCSSEPATDRTRPSSSTARPPCPPARPLTLVPCRLALQPRLVRRAHRVGRRRGDARDETRVAQPLHGIAAGSADAPPQGGVCSRKSERSERCPRHPKLHPPVTHPSHTRHTPVTHPSHTRYTPQVASPTRILFPVRRSSRWLQCSRASERHRRPSHC